MIASILSAVAVIWMGSALIWALGLIASVIMQGVIDRRTNAARAQIVAELERAMTGAKRDLIALDEVEWDDTRPREGSPCLN